MNYIVPHYVDREGGKTHTYDIFSRLLKDRAVMLTGEVEERGMSSIIAQLLVLDQESHKDIYLYINSPGGSVHAGLALYDTMNYIKSPVNTVVMGLAASMGCFLLSGGEKGKRYVLPNASIMAHQVSSGTRGHVLDQIASLEHTKSLNERLFSIMAKNIGMDVADLKKIADRDLWMTAEQAVELGFADKIIGTL